MLLQKILFGFFFLSLYKTILEEVKASQGKDNVIWEAQ